LGLFRGGTGHTHTALYRRQRKKRRTVMPLLLPFLIGIPVVVGGGWVIYKIVG
jgi:hypothetical protein